MRRSLQVALLSILMCAKSRMMIVHLARDRQSTCASTSKGYYTGLRDPGTLRAALSAVQVSN